MTGPKDLTGKFIRDTYPRVLQYDTGSGNLLLDGRGDAVLNLKLSGSLTTTESIATTYIDLNGLSLPDPAYTEGRIFYSSDTKTISIYNDVADVSLNIGEESWVRVVNRTGATLTNGTAVYIDGAQGNRPTVRPASSNNHSSSLVVGITTHDIINNAEGFVTTFGLVRGIDTTAFLEGDSLYLSGSNGEYTSSELPSPAHSTFLGYIVSSAVNGILLVSPRTTEELTGLHNVQENPEDGEVLFYDSINQVWSGSNERGFRIANDGVIFKRKVRTIYSNYTASATNDSVIFINGDADILLPNATSARNELNIKLISHNNIFIYASGSDTIEWEERANLNARGQSLTLIPSQSNWYII